MFQGLGGYSRPTFNSNAYLLESFVSEHIFGYVTIFMVFEVVIEVSAGDTCRDRGL